MWSLAWQFAGDRGVIEDIDVAWSESISLTRQSGNWRRASIDVLLPIDMRTCRHHPRTGAATLSWDGAISIAGRWQDPKYTQTSDGRARFTFDLADDESEDRGVWPPTSLQFPRRNPNEISWWDFVVVPGDSRPFHRRPAEVNDASPVLSKDEFPDIAEPNEGATWPYPIGMPGRGQNRPAVPAYVYDTRVGGGNFRKAGISGIPIGCATVTMYGPTDNGGVHPPMDTTASDTGIAVYSASRENGTAFAFIDLRDLVNVDNEPDFRFFWSATTEATPAGAGDVMLSILEASSVAVDFLEWRRVANRLNAYLIDGYCDAITTPMEFIRAQIGPLLPVSIVPGPLGLRPVLFPWLDDTSARGIDVVDGVGVCVSDSVTYLDSAPVKNVRVRFQYNPQVDACTWVTNADATMSVYGALPGDGETVEIEARFLADRATAQRVALDVLRWQGWSPRVLELQINDRARYGPGGSDDLYPGRRIVLECAQHGVSGMAAIIGEREYDATTALVRVYLLDDPLTAV